MLHSTLLPPKYKDIYVHSHYTITTCLWAICLQPGLLLPRPAMANYNQLPLNFPRQLAGNSSQKQNHSCHRITTLYIPASRCSVVWDPKLGFAGYQSVLQAGRGTKCHDVLSTHKHRWWTNKGRHMLSHWLFTGSWILSLTFQSQKPTKGPEGAKELSNSQRLIPPVEKSTTGSLSSLGGPAITAKKTGCTAGSPAMAKRTICRQRICHCF